MKRVNRTIAIILAAVLVLSLTGCGMSGKNPDKNADRQQLIDILNDISANLHPATAGSSLVSANLTADLIFWAAKTSLSKTEVAEIVGEWMMQQAPEIQAAFEQQLELIGTSYSQILQDGAKGLLDSAGVQKELPELNGGLKGVLDSILSFGGLD